MTLGLVGLGVVLLAGAGWLFRLQLAELTLRSVLAQRGIQAEGRVEVLDFGRAVVRDLRIGSPDAPDLTVAELRVELTWRGLTPDIRTVRLLEPSIHLRLDQGGRVTAGDLDRLSGGSPAGRSQRPVLPRMRLDIEQGQAEIDAPFGALQAKFEGTGTLGEDFSAFAWVAPSTHAGETYALDAGHAELMINAGRDRPLSFQITAAAEGLTWAGASFDDVALVVSGAAPFDLSQADAQVMTRFARLRTSDGPAVQDFESRATFETTMRADQLALARWRGVLDAGAQRLALHGGAVTQSRLNVQLEGEGDRAQGAWSLKSARFNGFELDAPSPEANGRLNLAAGALTVDGRVALANARLDQHGRENLRRALPEMSGAPAGPLFAQARRALDQALDRFSLTLPVQAQWSAGQGRVVIAQPIEARAASGAALIASPLRDDAPGVVVQLPQANLHGALSLDLHGGGLPSATLLMDSLDWAPDAPLDIDGSLTIAPWNVEHAAFAAQDIDLSLEQPVHGESTLNIKGPVRLTGPLGDGGVRDLKADLDLTVAWDKGWRVAPNHNCVPVQLGGLDAAGLSFQGGAFQFCAAQSGALIAADQRGRLSGGFLIQALKLDGRMSGPEGQPAHLTSSGVRGAFSGASNDIALNVEAETPRLAIEMARDRTLTVSGARITADARVTDRGWRVDGLFNSGVLADPTLPGAVTAIAGRWGAAPVEDRPVIRVAAGEARILARAPPQGATDARPTFNPMRLADVEATIESGEITAQGRLVLEAGTHPLARFTAMHHIDAGAGEAHVTADDLVFDQNFQPYAITELARGLVENVRGHASASADVAWTREAMTVTGHVRPEGLSLSMATIPVIEDVRGDVYFDNLLTLTTPPGQQLTVGLVNPGMAVRNGRLKFQLLADQHVSIEQAEFDLASGTLSVAPTTIALGADETRFELGLNNVDVETLLNQMNFGDLRATGRIEGTFPLLLTRRTALIQNGVLRTAPGGGTISYVGNESQGATGMAEVAFEALKDFHYDNLSLTLNGDISGDVVTSVKFSGVNVGRPINLAPVSPVPGIGELHARGVPFRFNVTITAPFRGLAEAVSTVTDPRSVLHRAEEAPPPVDQKAPSPR